MEAARLAFNRGFVDIVGSVVVPEIYIAPESAKYLFLRSKAMVKYSIVKEEELQTSRAPESTNESESSGPSNAEERKETKASAIPTQQCEDVSHRKRKRHEYSAESNSNSHRPSGSSLNWIISVPSAAKSLNGSVEVTIAASGLLQGATVKSRNDVEQAHRDTIRCSSRLCRQRLAQLFVDTVKTIRKNPFRVPQCSSDSKFDKQINGGDRIIDELDKTNDGEKSVETVIPDDFRSYRWWKDAYSSGWYIEGRQKFLENANFREWLCSNPSLGSNGALVQS